MCRIFTPLIVVWVIFSPLPTRADETIDVMAYCQYVAETVKSGPRTIRVTDPEPSIKEILGILEDTTATGGYELKSSSDVSSAEAIVLKVAGSNVPRRLIVYNPGWLQSDTVPEEGRWTVKGVLAHEIGHHVHSHLLSWEQSQSVDRPDFELKADYYTGWILSQMGANLEQAKLAVTKFTNNKPPPSYPPKDARALMVESGWTHSEAYKIAKNYRSTTKLILFSPLSAHTDGRLYILFGNDLIHENEHGVAYLMGNREESDRPRYVWTYKIPPQTQNEMPTQIWDDTKGKVWSEYGVVGDVMMPSVMTHTESPK
ncbi:MAG: hypothetical protein P0120_03185 [Nitrospira sp.]|nr:hypothetical protein [Nitrospira sp.]